MSRKRRQQLAELRRKLLAIHDITSHYSDLVDFPLDKEKSAPELVEFIFQVGKNHHHVMTASEDMIATIDELASEQSRAYAGDRRGMKAWIIVTLIALLLFWGPMVLIIILARF